MFVRYRELPSVPRAKILALSDLPLFLEECNELLKKGGFNHELWCNVFVGIGCIHERRSVPKWTSRYNGVIRGVDMRPSTLWVGEHWVVIWDLKS